MAERQRCGQRCGGNNGSCGATCTCNERRRICVPKTNYVTTTGSMRTGEQPYSDSFTQDIAYQNASGYYNSNDFMQFSNFVDDDTWSNHPGLFGWCWKGKKKCEADRVEKTVSSINSKHPFSKNDDCDTLDDRITKIDNSISGTATAPAGGRGAERVKNRTLAALEKRRLQIKGAYEGNDCSQQRLDEQTSEFNENIMTRFDEQYARESKREEDNSLMYVAVGVGILVIGAVVIMSINRQPGVVSTTPVASTTPV
jgi:hypothetical protein